MSSTHTSISRVCVVGGGPAGLASAIALTQRGFRVTLVDRATPPLDKACGEGLMPETVSVLNRLGVQLPEGAGFPFRGIRFIGSQSSVAADFPRGDAVGVRRLALHELLIRRAEQLGVECLWGAGKVQVNGKQVMAGSTCIEVDFVVAADGQNSSVRRSCGLSRTVCEKRRYGFRRHYRIAPWSSYMELYWGNECQIYVTPVAVDEVCIVSMSRNPELRLQKSLDQFPALQARLAVAEPTTRETGALSVTRKLRHVFKNNVALVGDASGSVDAITGEGLCLSFKQSLALAEALKSGDLPRYQSEHAKLSRRPHLMSGLLLTLDRQAPLQRRALASLSRCPQVFSSLLAIHVGEEPFSDLFSLHLLHFCREFLTA